MTRHSDRTNKIGGSPPNDLERDMDAINVAKCDPIAVSMAEFCRLTSLGRTTAYALARTNRIETRRVNGRTLVLTRSISALLDLDPPEQRP